MTLLSIFLFIIIHFFRNLDHLGRSMSTGWGSKILFSALRIETSVYPMSFLEHQVTPWTWPHWFTCQNPCASLRTLMGHCWLIQKLWRSCLPSDSLLWWWLSWASTAQANPTWWTSWLGRTRVSDTSRAQPSPFCLSTLPTCSTVMWGEKVRDLGGILKAIAWLKFS